MLGFEPLRRQFNLDHANLAGQWLPGEDLRKANLRDANLSRAYLRDANMSGAELRNANLSGATNLTQRQLDEACGNAELSEDLTLKPCAGRGW